MELMTILLLPIGIAAAFWGYKLRVLFRFLPGLWAGLLVGGASGYFLSFHLGGAVFGALLCGLIGAVISSAKEKAGVFLEFFAYGYAPILFLTTPVVAASIGENVSTGGNVSIGILIPTFIFAVAVGALLGWLAARFAARVWIIISTGLLGGVLGGIAVGGMNPGVGFMVGLLMAVAGMIVQLTITAKPGAGPQAPTAPAGPTVQAAAVPPAVGTTPAVEETPIQQPIPTKPSAAAPAQEDTVSTDGAKFCPNCGKPVTPGTKFCPECGQSLTAEQ